MRTRFPAIRIFGDATIPYLTGSAACFSAVWFGMVLFAGLSWFPVRAEAVLRKVEVVALSGDPAPGTNANFAAGFDPRDVWFSGDYVLFGAGTTVPPGHPEEGIPGVGFWGGFRSDIGLVARHGNPAPGIGGSFQFFSSSRYGMVDRTSTFGLWGAADTLGLFLGYSIWIGATGLEGPGVHFEHVVSENDPAPGTNGKASFLHLSRSSLPAFNNGRTAFFATLQGQAPDVNSNNDSGIWSGGPEGVSLVVRENDPMPGQPEDALFNAFGEITLTLGGVVAFVANAKFPVSAQALYGWTAGAGLFKVADQAEFGTISNVTVNEQSEVAFSGSVLGKPAVYTEVLGDFRTVAVVDQVAPNADGEPSGVTFAQLLHFVLTDNSGIVLLAQTSDGKRGIWREDDKAVLRRLVHKGDPAPGPAGNPTFADFRNMVAGDGGIVAFEATTTASTQGGYWRISEDGVVKPLLVPGDQIEVKPGDIRTVTSVKGATPISPPAASKVSTGVDGTPTFMTADDILLQVQMNNFSSAALILSPVSTELVVNHTGNAEDNNPGDEICDTGGPLVDGQPECTLRAAIMEANARGGRDRIKFDIPATDAGHQAGVWTIQVPSPLPPATGPVDIDASTQPGYPGSPLIAIDGAPLALPTIGLDITGGLSRVRGFSIINFAGDGIRLFGPGENVVEANYVGVKPDGVTGGPNKQNGILVNNCPDNRIGGPVPSQRNVVSGSGFSSTSGANIRIMNPAATGNRVEGNYVGVNAAGTAGYANLTGVLIEDASDNIIGGATPERGNLIAGNSRGIDISGPAATSNRIQGNILGLASDGTTVISNSRGGVVISAPGVIVGGPSDTPGLAPGNVISGSGSDSFAGHGIQVVGPDAIGTIIQGNLIGTDAVGEPAASNWGAGIQILAADSTKIGGVDPRERNVIVASELSGVWVDGEGSEGTIVRGNYIGVLGNGVETLGNGLDGIRLEESATTIVEKNVIAGNAGNGIYVLGSPATGNHIRGNRIGIGPLAVVLSGNGGDGVRIEDAPGNLVGGDEAADRNWIGRNTWGVRVTGAAAAGNTIQGNWIGLETDGVTPAPNTAGGVRIEGAPASLVGGPADTTGQAPGNLISGNGSDDGGAHGVDVTGETAVETVVQGNVIGLDATGTLSVSNRGAGVHVQEADSVLVGGVGAAAKNVICANDSAGIWIEGAATRGTRVLGNYLGIRDAFTGISGNGLEGLRISDSPENVVENNLSGGNFGHGMLVQGENAIGNWFYGNGLGSDRAGAYIVGNFGDGLRIESASETEIGVAGGAPGNIIANNRLAGIRVTGGIRNAIRENEIFANGALAIDLGEAPGVNPNDELDTDEGPNGYQNYPTITRAVTDTSTATFTIRGVMRGDRLKELILEFFAAVDCDPSGFGEGDIHLGSLVVLTDADGRAPFVFSVPLAAIPLVPQFVTGTATDLTGNTSEFSACFASTTGSSDATLIVNSTADASDLVPGDGVCDTGNMIGAEPECTLRAAIEEANALAGFQDILFDITGIGPHTIQPAGALPAVGSAAIDATSQPGYAGLPVVTLEGSLAGDATGLRLAGGASLSGLAIHGFAGAGVLLSGTGNVVEGNHVGTGVGGEEVVPNSGPGILVDGADNNRIGRVGGAFPNRIANNGGDGVRISGGEGNRITGNAIFANALLGVNLAGGSETPDGVTANDPGDSDGGPNGLQNAPALSTTTLSDESVRIEGSFSSSSNSRFMLEFFASDACDPSGRGEAAIYLGSAEVETDGKGSAEFTAVLGFDTTDPGKLVLLASLDGMVVTATATDSIGNTSELSNCANATRTPVALLSFSAAPARPGIAIAFRFTEDSDPTGFHLFRRDGEHRHLPASLDEWERVTPSLLLPARVSATGASATPGEVLWTDLDVEPRRIYSYVLQSIDRAGHAQLFGPVSAAASSPAATRVIVSPNPASGATRIQFELPAESAVEVLVFDVTGRLVRSLDAGRYPAGRHAVVWNARDSRGAGTPAGIYFVHLRTDHGEARARFALQP